MAIFNKSDILIPKNADLTKWAVVACDQYTSQPEYWQNVANEVGDSPSTLNLVYPEAFLSEGDTRIEKINASMAEYVEKGLFDTYKDCFIYIERTLSGGRVRKGIIGAIDLEEYDFHKGACTYIRATEGTVLDRIPPRVAIRRDAPIELPHIMILIDDPEKTVIEPIARKANKYHVAYDIDLMGGGGHAKGYLWQTAVTSRDILLTERILRV